MPHPTKMSSDDTALLVIDVQEKLMTKIPNAKELIHNIAFLIDGAKIAGVPVFATEQYPKGLGKTVAGLIDRLPDRPEKLAFSSCVVPEILEGIHKEGRQKVVLVGIETHVCVLQTALDLLAEGIRVYVAVDSVSSRYPIDYEYALVRLDHTDAVLTTSETCVFEWIGGADHPQFKQISQLVQNRMNVLEEDPK
ncbi:MAG: hydrolase [Gemmataceae bacterium]